MFQPNKMKMTSCLKPQTEYQSLAVQNLCHNFWANRVLEETEFWGNNLFGIQ